MTLRNNTDVNGNKDAKGLLKQFLDLAEVEPIGYVSIIAAKEPNTFMVGFSGTVELERVGLEGLRKSEEIIQANLDNRTMPDRDPALDESYVCYNVTTSPLSYDFLTWVMDQEQRRINAKAPGPLKVAFWYGRDGKTGLSGMPDREQMLNKVCRPAMELMGAVEDPRALLGHTSEFFSYKRTVDLYKQTGIIPKFTTKTKSPIKKPGYVTITLRETTYWPHRNSRMEEWLQFARYLKSKGERVIFVRDTRVADEPIEGFETCPVASRDLTQRCALYRDAKCNCFVANGPISLAYFGDAPWLKFFEIDDQGAYNAAKSEYWRVCVGLDPDKQEQFPWSGPKQRIVWKPDFFTNMVLAWEENFGPSSTPSTKKECSGICGTSGTTKPRKSVRKSKRVTKRTSTTKA